MKNLSLGYTLPQKWMSKIHVKSLRFAVTLTDFFTHSHFPEGWDPRSALPAIPSPNRCSSPHSLNSNVVSKNEKI